jgi:hypothetical protein
VAFCDGEIVGVSTVELSTLPQLGCRFGFFRCLVAPEYRQQHIARRLAVYSRDLLSSWSRENPAEHVLGLATAVESPDLAEFGKLPVWSASGLTLIGYTEAGAQLRVVWFDHAVLGHGQPPVKNFERSGEAELVSVWQKNDPTMTAQATDLWNRLGILPARITPAERAKQLCAGVYVGGTLCGVSTMELSFFPPLRARFGFFRCLVANDIRRRGLATTLTIYSRNVLAAWSEQNPQERVLGMATVIENPKLDELARLPVWSTSEFDNGLTLIGHTARGLQIRLSWFEHARLD